MPWSVQKCFFLATVITKVKSAHSKTLNHYRNVILKWEVSVNCGCVFFRSPPHADTCMQTHTPHSFIIILQLAFLTQQYFVNVFRSVFFFEAISLINEYLLFYCFEITWFYFVPPAKVSIWMLGGHLLTSEVVYNIIVGKACCTAISMVSSHSCWRTKPLRTC